MTDLASRKKASPADSLPAVAEADAQAQSAVRPITIWAVVGAAFPGVQLYV